MKKEIKKIVEEIMQEGFDVAMGGDAFKSQEQNKEIQERKYDEAIGKWAKIIKKAIQQERERIIEEIRVRKKVLKELIGKFNLDIDKHRLDELEQIENILTPLTNKYEKRNKRILLHERANG